MGSFVFRMATRSGGNGRATSPDGLAGTWTACGPCRARVINNGFGPLATLVRSPFGLAAGLVRLDNRRDISRLTQSADDQSDLSIIVAALAQHGERVVREFVGEFAFAFWDDTRRVLIAARDALGVRTLYCSDDSSEVAFASRAIFLGADRPWSLEYVARYVADGPPRMRTVYEGVTPVQRGTYVVLHGERRVEHRYWSPFEFDTTWTMDSREAVEQFKGLFTDAMRLHLTGNTGCWSQLSGGLDSSSVVSMAGWLAKTDPTIPKLSGTITYVDTLGMGDERVYSDTVIRDWSLKNEQLVDCRPWDETETDLSGPDEPEYVSMFARDARTCRAVCSTGGRILLTGVGPDQYLHGNYSYFADWIAKGRIRDAVREIFREAVRNKTSFWTLAYQNGIVPFIRREAQPSDRWPSWVRPEFARQFSIEEILSPHRPRRAAIGRHFVTQAAENVDSFDNAVWRGAVGDTLDVRYPFLHRPLVEFCLRLPPELKVNQGLHKWVLREAMRGILPEKIRRRTSKGFVNGGIERSYVAHHARLNALLERSTLSDMGCIDVSLARQALRDRTNRPRSESRRLEFLLDLEAWFAVRSGRWTASEL